MHRFGLGNFTLAFEAITGALGHEFPLPEYLVIMPPRDYGTLRFPKRFQCPAPTAHLSSRLCLFKTFSYLTYNLITLFVEFTDLSGGVEVA